MTETIIILVATMVVFSLFLVVYFFKDRSNSDNRHRSACARCDCHRGQQQDGRPIRQPKKIEKEAMPCSTGRSVKCSASD